VQAAAGARGGEVGTAAMSPAEQPLPDGLYEAISYVILLPVTSLGQPAELHQCTEGNWKVIPPVLRPRDCFTSPFCTIDSPATPSILARSREVLCSALLFDSVVAAQTLSTSRCAPSTCFASSWSQAGYGAPGTGIAGSGALSALQLPSG